ncbi:putative papain-like cysteine peptidase superfamily [Helianthus anomalus]
MIHRNPVDKNYYGHIINSSNGEKDASRYKITELFEKATKTKIMWKIENCHQQSGTWECGYYVMHAMYDFLITCREHLMMYNSRPLTRCEIDKFVENILKTFKTY